MIRTRAARRLGDDNQAPLDHAELNIAILSLIVTPVLARNGKRIIEVQANYLELRVTRILQDRRAGLG